MGSSAAGSLPMTSSPRLGSAKATLEVLPVKTAVRPSEARAVSVTRTVRAGMMAGIIAE